MKPYISDFVSGTEVTSYFITSSKPEVRKAKNGSGYLVLKLMDRSGEIEARLWGMASGAESPVKEGAIVKVRAEVSEWQGSNQLKITQIREVNESDDVDQSDLFQCAERPAEEMWSDLQRILNDHMDWGSPLHRLLEHIMQDDGPALRAAPAAKSVHNAYTGGLLEHILSMARITIYVGGHYGLDKELLLAGCVLHDWMKTKELNFPIISYTLEGSLLGHLSMGLIAVSKAMDSFPDFPKKTRIALLHLLAAHHGQKDFGSPVTPMTREAHAFHLIDMLDSKMFICKKALAAGTNDEGFTVWVKPLDGMIWQEPKEKSEDA